MPRTLATNRVLVRDFGTCLSFADNTTDHIAEAHTTGLPITTQLAFTISLWCNISSSVAGGNYLFSEGNSGSTNQIWGVHLKAAGSPILSLFSRNNAATGSDQVGTVPILTFGGWQHIVITGNSGAIKIFSNGVDTTATFTTQSGATTLNITTWGALGRTTFGGSLGGFLDECMIFSRILSNTEIATLYTSGTFDSTNLVSYFKLNEGSGSTAVDSSGNGNTGTITGATYSSLVASVPRTLATGRTLASGRALAT